MVVHFLTFKETATIKLYKYCPEELFGLSGDPELLFDHCLLDGSSSLQQPFLSVCPEISFSFLEIDSRSSDLLRCWPLGNNFIVSL